MAATYKQGSPQCLQSIWKHYVHQVFSGVQSAGIMLITDDISMKMITVASSMTELTSYRVYGVNTLTEVLKHPKDHKDMTAVFLVRPWRKTFEQMIRILQHNSFCSYHVVFTNLSSQTFLPDLALSDKEGKVHAVKEVFADYLALDSHLFLVPPPPANTPITIMENMDHGWQDCLIQAVSAVAASLRCKPHIRYQANSTPAAEIASQLWSLINTQEKEVYSFGGKSDCTVLILDRCGDPITPLLLPWTYQAMVHEHFGLNLNVFPLPDKSGKAEDTVLSTLTDDFFRRHLGDNFGDLGEAVKVEVDKAARAEGVARNIQSLQDMREVLANHTDMSAQKTLAAKHVGILDSMNKIVDGRDLFSASEQEQMIACTPGGPQSDFDQVEALIKGGKLQYNDVARLALLYALRYESKASDISRLKRILSESGYDNSRRIQDAMDKVLKYAGAAKRQEDILAESVKARLRRAGTSMRGVENVFTMHKPLLVTQLEDCAAGKLSTAYYPFKEQNDAKAAAMSNIQTPMSTIIVLMIGGCTYSESLVVKKFNESTNRPRKTRVVLGSQAVLNSKMFIELLSNGRLEGYKEPQQAAW